MKKVFSLMALALLCGCGEAQDRVSSLPLRDQVEVKAIDTKIAEMQRMLERLEARSSQEDVKADEEIFAQWSQFAESVKLATTARERANILRARIDELKARRQEILGQ